MIASWLESQFGEKSRGTCGRDDILRDEPGSSPLDLLKTVRQRLLMEVPDYCSILLDEQGLNKTFVAVGVNIKLWIHTCGTDVVWKRQWRKS